ncbi:MAG: DUF3592 domain-containing protein [Candidatus Micrarchaeota archaeon]|nr:DUF3592 domain-containing protein [Candidatus Micrarchaeota archaeon]
METRQIIYLLISIGFLCFGLFLAYSGIQTEILSIQSSSWATSQGVITHSSVIVEQPSGSSCARGCPPRYSPLITYSYNVNGKVLDGTNVTFFNNYDNVFGFNYAYQIVSEYPVGSNVTVHYNPSNPSEVVLQAGFSFIGLFIPIIGIVLFLGSCFALYMIIIRNSVVKS